MKTKNILLLTGGIFLLIFSSCSKDFLEKTPVSKLTPENYLKAEADLRSYSINLYNDIMPTGGNPFANDNGSDCMISRGGDGDKKYSVDQMRTGQDGGDWDFGHIFQINYFMETVIPRFKANTISGDINLVKHDIGEMYFMRAMEYFNRLKALGDFPILRTTIPDNAELLTEASKRKPQNEVARFIISDLDSAIMLLQAKSPDGAKNRLDQNCARLFKSRVALYEGTWLKYFKGTALVPGDDKWPGKNVDYNANFAFAAGSIDAESNWFLDQAIAESKIVADFGMGDLTANTGTVQQSTAAPINPYFNMFGDIDQSVYKEVLLWRKYDRTLSVNNNIAVEMGYGNSGNGDTRNYIESFLMSNGLPIYAAGSGYAGDDTISLVRKGRDSRLSIFIKQPFQLNILYPDKAGDHSRPVEPYPDITNSLTNSDYPTGYCNRKGLSYYEVLASQGQGYTGEIIFRSAEAILNYMEAKYERGGTLADIEPYWDAIRKRALLPSAPGDIQKTLDAIDMNQEVMWSKYSAGNVVDKTLYMIRQERAWELKAEGFRNDDLRRWRSMDQLIATPFHIEGFKLWGPMQKWYKKSLLTYGKGNSSTVSDPKISLYLRPFERSSTHVYYNGLTWTMAHYLKPIAIHHFLLTSPDNATASKSVIYQNPGWPYTANTAASAF